MNTVDFFSAEVVAAAGTADSDEFEMGQAHDSGVLAVNVNVGAGVECVTLTVYGRDRGGTWLPVNIVDLNTQLGDLVQSVVYTADYTSANALLIPTPVEEIKVSLANTGASNAIVTVTGFFR